MKKRLSRLLSIAVLGFTVLLLGDASAAPITKTITVQVYQFCDDAGLNCASTGPAGNAYFAAETNKIWNQAGVSVGFNFAGQIHNTFFSNVDEGILGNTFFDLHSNYGSGGPSATTVDIFLVRTVAGAYGVGWVGQGGMLLAMDSIILKTAVDLAH